MCLCAAEKSQMSRGQREREVERGGTYLACGPLGAGAA